MASVFLVQRLRDQADRAPRDFSGLEKFGKIINLVDERDTPSLRQNMTRSKISARLKNFDPERDYFAWFGGDPISILFLADELLRLGIKRFCWLRYTRQNEAPGRYTIVYIPTWVDISRPPDVDPT